MGKNDNIFIVGDNNIVVLGQEKLNIPDGIDTSFPDLKTARYAAALLDCEDVFSTDLQHADMCAVYYWREEILSALAIAKQLQEKEDE